MLKIYNNTINILAICALGNKGNIKTESVQIVIPSKRMSQDTELMNEKGNSWGIKLLILRVGSFKLFCLTLENNKELYLFKIGYEESLSSKV